jgi:hypothetical protein
MENIYKQIIETAENAGLKVISDDHCCKLLAWLYAYGGANEAVLYNVKLNANILIAQKRLNINGSERPNSELFDLLKKYLNEVEPIMNGKSKEHPKFIYEICDYYGLSRNTIS